MGNKKCWLATLAVTVAYFLLGGLFYGLLMKDWFASQAEHAGMEPNMPIIALACLVYGILMAYTYPLGYKGGSAGKEGVRFGILFGLIVNGPSGLFMLAMAQCNWPALIVSWVWEVIVGAVLGVLIAKIYGESAA